MNALQNPRLLNHPSDTLPRRQWRWTCCYWKMNLCAVVYSLNAYRDIVVRKFKLLFPDVCRFAVKYAFKV